MLDQPPHRRLERVQRGCQVLYQAGWWLYLFTHYRDEAGTLSMWDIIAEKFGLMLVWGLPLLLTVGSARAPPCPVVTWERPSGAGAPCRYGDFSPPANSSGEPT